MTALILSIAYHAGKLSNGGRNSLVREVIKDPGVNQNKLQKSLDETGEAS